MIKIHDLFQIYFEIHSLIINEIIYFLNNY